MSSIAVLPAMLPCFRCRAPAARETSLDAEVCPGLQLELAWAPASVISTLSRGTRLALDTHQRGAYSQPRWVLAVLLFPTRR